MFVPYRKHVCAPPRPATRIALISYIDDVCTLPETHLRVFMICYRAVTEIVLYFYTPMIFAPGRKRTNGPPWPFTGIALLYYKNMMFAPHRKHVYISQRPVIYIALVFYMYILSVPNRNLRRRGSRLPHFSTHSAHMWW
jgi:hypothetical protein